jgi:hypothetical protein
MGTIAVLLLARCAAPPPVDQEDLRRYLLQAAAWAPQEAEVARAIGRVLETEFVDEAEVRRQLAESLPRVEAQLAVIEAYAPATIRLQSIHSRYVHAWRELQGAYAKIVRGFDTQDPAALAAGRGALLAWRQAIPAAARQLRELTDAAPEPEMDRGPPI